MRTSPDPAEASTGACDEFDSLRRLLRDRGRGDADSPDRGLPCSGRRMELGLRTLTFVSLPFLILAVYLRFLVQADYGFHVTNAAWLITPVANVSVNGLLAVIGLLSVATALTTWIAGQVLGTALLVWYVSRRLAGFGRPDLVLARRMAWFGVKAHAGRVMLLGNYRLDQWILGAVSGSRELGLYSVAVAWAEALWQLPTALAAVQRPNVVRAKAREAARQAAMAFRAATAFTMVLELMFVRRRRFLRDLLRRVVPRVNRRSACACARCLRSRCGKAARERADGAGQAHAG